MDQNTETTQESQESEPKLPITSTKQYERYERQIGGTTFKVYKHYEIFKIVGQGAFGVVACARNKLNNTEVAIKKIPNIFGNLLDAKKALREIKLLKFFNHKNIISLLDIILPDNSKTYDEIYLVFELMDLDLRKLINSHLVTTSFIIFQVLKDKQINWFMYQMMVGVYYLHSADVIHRDLKPDNLLITKDCTLKIADLNLARKLDQLDDQFVTWQSLIIYGTSYVVSRWYRAPEVLFSQSEYTKAIDIWSIGCILAELLGRTILFEGNDPIQQTEKIVAVMGTPKPEELPYTIDPTTESFIRSLPKREPVPWKEMYPYANPLAVDLLSKLLVIKLLLILKIYNPEQRLTIQNCLEHPYFSDCYERFPPDTCQRSVDWSFDQVELDRDTLRQTIYDEAISFNFNQIKKNN